MSNSPGFKRSSEC